MCRRDREATAVAAPASTLSSRGAFPVIVAAG
jgi:hypothetical protein